MIFWAQRDCDCDSRGSVYGVLGLNWGCEIGDGGGGGGIEVKQHFICAMAEVGGALY